MSEPIETRDVTARAAWGLAGVLGTLLGGGMLAAGLLLSILSSLQARRDPEPRPLIDPAPAPAEPRLTAETPAELRALRARERALLNAWEWVDRERGVARIPIERAMGLLLEKGLPVREEDP